MIGAIEAGGTKFVCAVGTGPDDLVEDRFPTTTPDETIARAIKFFRTHDGIRAIGIGTFGPADVDPDSPTFGNITTTPKPGWQNTDLVGALRTEFEVPFAFDTDVNAALLGEHRWGAAQGIGDALYFTIGTGIGGGAMVGGRLVHGLLHPEMGHLRIPRDPNDGFEGVCPYHGDCFEGLASGPAIEERWGTRADQLPADHEAWDLQAQYLALAMANVTFLYSPRRIVLGGGVMEQRQLFEKTRRRLRELVNGYLGTPLLGDAIDEYLVPPGLGNRAGILGAIALGAQVLR